MSLGHKQETVVLCKSPNVINTTSSGVNVVYRNKGLLLHFGISHKQKLIIQGE